MKKVAGLIPGSPGVVWVEFASSHLVWVGSHRVLYFHEHNPKRCMWGDLETLIWPSDCDCDCEKWMAWMLTTGEHLFTGHSVSITRFLPGGCDQQQRPKSLTVNQMWWVITLSKRQQFSAFDHLESWLSRVIMTTCDVHMPKEPKNSSPQPRSSILHCHTKMIIKKKTLTSFI